MISSASTAKPAASKDASKSRTNPPPDAGSRLHRPAAMFSQNVSGSNAPGTTQPRPTIATGSCSTSMPAGTAHELHAEQFHPRRPVRVDQRDVTRRAEIVSPLRHDHAAGLGLDGAGPVHPAFANGHRQRAAGARPPRPH